VEEHLGTFVLPNAWYSLLRVWSVVTALAVWDYKDDNFKTMSNEAMRVCKEGLRTMILNRCMRLGHAEMLITIIFQ
jgi:hypothetical protein